MFVETILYILAKIVQLSLDLVSLAMMVRALLPFFFDAEGNRIYTLSVMISEPLITPVRFLLYKLNVGQSSPIDWSFFITYILIAILRSSLPII